MHIFIYTMCYTLMGSVQKKKNKEEKLPKKLWEIKVCREKAREKVKKKCILKWAWFDFNLLFNYLLENGGEKKKKGERWNIQCIRGKLSSVLKLQFGKN